MNEQDEEKIRELAHLHQGTMTDSQYLQMRYALEDMVTWKESQPFYVVTRCEEHSDYVERLFNDEQKAIDYCNKFNDNPDEYSRHYKKINLTL